MIDKMIVPEDVFNLIIESALEASEAEAKLCDGENYNRLEDLPKLITGFKIFSPWPVDLDMVQDHIEITEEYISQLTVKINIESKKMRSAHWSYDYSLHKNICNALNGERKILKNLKEMSKHV